MTKLRYVTCSCFALIHLGLGDKQTSLDWIEKGCERRELTVSTLGVHPAYDALRSEARFQALTKRVGFTTQTT